MAFRPSLRSIWTLISMAIVCYGLYLWAEYSRVEVRRDYYETKLLAAEKMNEALSALSDRNLAGGETIETYGDPRIDAIIGQQFSTITTDIGSFEAKLSGANPNLAAVAVELLISAGVSKGDRVAIAMTGSNPGVNLAVLSACTAMNIEAYTITALGATWWGANDPRNTWVDMQKYLIDRKILSSVIVAVSRGGIDDNALGLSSSGKAELADAATRTNSKLLESSSASLAGVLWWSTLKKASATQKYSAYINIGEGIASLGHPENGMLLANGLHKQLPSRNWPGRGAIHLASQEGVQVLQIFDVVKLSNDFGLGSPKVLLSDPGQGDVFTTVRYDLRIAVFALVVALAALFVLVWFDAKYFRLADAGVDPETLL